jgi:DUF2075 family protein
MIAYKATKDQFLKDAPTIEDKIRKGVKEKIGIDIKVESSEYNSWKNSIGNAMFHVINNSKLPDQAKIAIEYQLTGQKMRIDFLVSGKDKENKKNIVIVELKQWSQIEISLMRDHVMTYMGGRKVETQHPSYQANSYVISLRNFNPVIDRHDIMLSSCAYLHNCMDSSVIKDKSFKLLFSKSPIFIKSEGNSLTNFLEEKIVLGEESDLFTEIEESPLVISKSLSQNIGSMLKDNVDFALIDDQKTALEEILYHHKTLKNGEKKVLIVEGGPGTGKSLIAINALVDIVKSGVNARYVTNNSAPRKVYQAQLAKNKDKSEIDALFSSPDQFKECDSDTYDVVLVDEAHRLTSNWGFYKTKGDSQVKAIIAASKLSVFFIDDLQKVTWNDLGTVAEIEKWSTKFKVEPHKRILNMQFRCAGSDSYITWINQMLELVEKTNDVTSFDSYDFQVFDSPSEMRDLIFEKNNELNRARLVAGYCWEWVSKKSPNLYDIEFKDFDFKMKWNLSSDPTWILSPDSVNQVGCIHTSQGLETDYVGVIMGSDFVIRNGKVITSPEKRAKTDQSLKGWKKELAIDEETALLKADQLIKNTYRALLTRGMKGCYLYSVDKETNEYFKSQIPSIKRDKFHG